MAVNLSALAGAGQQFFTDVGVPLSGGKLYSYAAGTTTPQATYTTAAGTIAHANPIILDSAGRISTGEIWLTAGSNYKFVLKTSTDTTIATWDNITGINGTGITSNASNVQYDPAGTGAVSTTVQAKLRESVSVKDFGAVGDGSTNDTTAFTNAIATGAGCINIPDGTYKITSQLALGAGQRLVGSSRVTAILNHTFNGDMLTMADGSGLFNLYLAGQGATYTGKGVKITGTNGRQTIQNCKITDFSDNCIYFEKDAGSQCSVSNLIASQNSGGTGTGKYAIAVEDVASTSGQAVPRKFIQIETNGFCAFDFGGANDFFVSNSFIADLNYSTNSRAVLITDSRIANQTALTVRGANHTIVGCDIAPALTISAIDNVAIQGNSYNNLPIVNNVGNPRVLLDAWTVSYTPTLTSGAGSPSLGNGTLTGYYTFDGSYVNAYISLTLGSTTSLGTGEIRFSLPKVAYVDQVVGQGWISVASVNYTAIAKMGSSQSYVALVRDTSGSVTYNSPGVFTAGDFIRVQVSYF